MKDVNGGTQMRDVWQLPAIGRWEKTCGKHPTQKPLPLLARIIQASTKENAWILDPFCGSSTTGIAANLLNRRYLGIDQELEFLKMSKKRQQEIDNAAIRMDYRNRICKAADSDLQHILELHENNPYYGVDLPIK